MSYQLAQRHFIRPLQSLRGRLMLTYGVALPAVLFLCGLGAGWLTYQTSEAAWRGRQSEAALNAATTVRTFLQRSEDALFILGHLGLEELKTKPQILQELLKQNPAFLEVTYLDADGRPAIDASQDAPVLANLITIWQAQWYLDAKAGRRYWGDFQLSPQSEPYMIMAIPSPEHRVVVARLRMNVLWEVVGQIRFGRTGRAYVVDGRGRIIAHTDPNVVLEQTNINDRPEMASLLEAPNHQWVGRYVNFQGVPVVASTAPVDGADWVVVTELPQAEAFEATRNALLLLAVGAAVLAFFSIFAAGRFLRRLLFVPIERLRTGAQRIGEGDLAFQIQVERADEIGQLATTFNEMAGALRTRDEQLAGQNIALLTEVTERRHVERALRESEERLRAILDSVQTGVVIIDPEAHRIVDANPAALRLIGAEREQVLARIDGCPLRVVGRGAPHANGGHCAENEETLLLRADGTTCPIMKTVVPVVLNGQPHLLESFVDITARKEAEAELRRLNEELEARVTARTAELVAEIGVRQEAEDQVRASLAEKEVLLKEINHRVKNNLQVISSMLHMQSKTLGDARLMEVLWESENRVRAMALIHEKLYRSADLASINLGDYIRDLAGELVRSYGPRAGKVQLRVQSSNVSLPLDSAVPCGLIINELISNALKHAFPNGRTGRIEVDLVQCDTGQLHLIVADDGVGLAPGQDMLASSSLGMKLVTNLVKQLKATLDIQSGPGMRFAIALPPTTWRGGAS